MKILKLFSFLLISSYIFSGVSESDLAYVPYYANLTESLITPNNEIKEGTRFIVIRIEGNRVLGNFSRKGIHELALSKTNIEDLVSEKKLVGEPSSRIAFFIGNKLASGESNWKYLIHIDEIRQYEEWVILYAPSSDPNIKQLLLQFNKQFLRSKIESPKTLFVFIDTEGDQKALDQLGNDLDLSIATLPWYLSRGYVKGLGHLSQKDETIFPALAIVKATNNVKSVYQGSNSVLQYLSSSHN